MKAAELTCPACGTAYAVTDLDPRWAWACAACDQILAPGGAPTRWLYARAATAAGPRLHRTFGQFQLREEVGRGGMGVVYHAWDRDRARHVALKILLSGEFSSPEHLERFAREARSAALASHPNLVRVHDIGWLEERAYFTMDLVDGPTLQEVLERRGTLPVHEAVRIAAGIARGLAAAHAAAVVHRDVKPANVVLTVDGTPRLTDFGLARAPTGHGQRLTRTDQLMGTPTYMAPEQLTSSRAVDARTDQYALGAVLYEMVSGTTPYLGDDPAQVMAAVARGAPTPIRRRLPSLPGPVATMIDKAMARDPQRRYPTTDAFADDLERFLRGEPILARPPTSREVAASFARAHSAALSGIVSGLFGVTVLVALALVGARWLAAEAEDRRAADAELRLLELADQAERARVDEPDRAVALLRDYAKEAAWNGTPAVAEAWARCGKLLEDLDRHAEAADAWAASYAAALEPLAQDQALRGLGSAFAAAEDWEPLRRVVELMTARNPAVSTDPRVAWWNAQAMLGGRELPLAASVLRDAGLPGADLVAALSTFTPMPLSGWVRNADVNRDGVLEVWAATRDGRITRWEAGATAEWMLPRPPTEPREVFAIAGDPPLVLAHHEGGEAALYAARSDATGPIGAPLFSWREEVLLSAVAGDVDRDGDWEVWVGVGPYGRHLVTLSPRRGWHLESRVPSVDATASDVDALALADLDADGKIELVAALGPWSAYDLRAFRPRARGMETLARHKLGHVSALVPVEGAVWALKTDGFPSRVVFPAHEPTGAASGAYRMVLAPGPGGPRWEVDRMLPASRPLSPYAASMLVADLDANGVDDVVWVTETSTVIWADGDPVRPPLTIGGMVARAVVQADDDPADELLVELAPDGRLAMLGAGPDRLPPLDRALTGPPPAFPRGWVGASPAVRAAERAEQLVTIGRVRAALDQLQWVAAGTDDPVLLPLVRQRAAELAESLGEDALAADLYRAVGTPRAMLAAATNDVRAHRLTQAAAALRSLGSPEAPALDRIDAETAVHRWTFDEPLSAAFDVLDPVAVKVDPRKHALAVGAMADDDDLLRIPFRWDGDRLGLSVELDLQQLEWSGGVAFELVDAAGTQQLLVSVSGWGGGGLTELQIGCFGSSFVGSAERVPWPGDAEAPISLSIDAARPPGDVRCKLDGPSISRRTNLPLTSFPTGGAWELRVRPTRHGSTRSPALARIAIRTLTLTATHLQLTPPSDDAAAWRRAAAVGKDQEPPPAGENPIAWAVAAARAGDGARAAAALRAGLDSDPDRTLRELRQALRLQLPTFGPVAQRVLGPAYLAQFALAFEVPLNQGATPDLELALTTGLPQLDRPSRSPGAHDVGGRLLAARGLAWMSLGQHDAAQRDLEAAVALAPARSEPRGWASTARVALAGLYASVGDDATALARVREAIEASTAPEITSDLVRASPELGPRCADPSWAGVLR